MNRPSFLTDPAAKPAGQPPVRILVFISEDFAFLSHRRDLLMGLVREGYDVRLATNLADRKSEVEATGIPTIQVNIENRNLSLLTFFRKVREYARIVKSTRPDVIFAVALKPAVIAAVAGCFHRRTPSLYAIAGLGVTFSDEAKNQRVGFVRRCFELTFRRLLNRPWRYCLFQNHDDRDFFLKRRWTTPERSFVIPGAGVPVEDFPTKQWRNDHPVRFLFAGRMLPEKGVEYLFEACRILQARGVSFECQMAGFFDRSGNATISREDLERRDREGLIQWLGARDDVPELMSRADCFVFPSIYREGVPRVLLEACAAGIPSITTDNVGCRDVIGHEVNGLLVPPKDPAALADAMERVVRERHQLRVWGARARAKALEQFTVGRVLSAHLKIFDQILPRASV